ncbi:MAG: hypothetical protein H6708_05135 [Kofleriaceae bacterium]|nr:hypothetical protein [Myxococcales bacterium]MCB9559772.1 hypothetical protein [Kofleriaceae bacterium]
MRSFNVLLLGALASLAACTGDITNPGGPGGPGGDDDTTDPSDPDTPIGPQDPDYSAQHPRIYLERNRDRLTAALDANAPGVARFRQVVDAQLGGADTYNFQAWFAGLLGQLTGDDRYCTYAVGYIDDFVASEEAAIANGQNPGAAFDSYLEVGPLVGDVMLTYDWCYDATSASQRERWLAYAAQAVWNVWHPSQATWGGRAASWSGWSTDNPSNNYYYSFLRATMLFGLAAHDEHPDAAGWLDFFREQKFQDQLVPTFEGDLTGGGSREGTGYGTSMHRLWELYDLWEGSTGEDLARQTTHTRASMLYLMHAIVPTLDRFAPIGDQSRDSSASLFDYHRNYLQELAYLFRDDALAPHARWVIDNSSVPAMEQTYMAPYDFLYGDQAMTPTAPDDLKRVYYGPGTGHTFARSSWDADGTWLNAIAGPYTESHAHHDQGSLMLYKGTWLAYDAGVASNSGIRPEEELHNVVRLVQGGSTIRQREGTTSATTALHRGAGWVHWAGDVTAAYNGNASVDGVVRELVFIEPDTVVVFDRVSTATGTQQVWQLNTPGQPSVSGARATISTGGHTLEVERLLPAGATMAVSDWSGDGDVHGGYRLDDTVAGGDQRFLHVLAVDGSVTSSTASDAGSQHGVRLQLADGRTATVRFEDAAVGGTLEITGGSSPVSVTLGAGIDY